MKVKCVNNQDGGDYLTIGREYAVVAEEGAWYRVVNDENFESIYHHSQFEIVGDEQPLATTPRKFSVGDKVKIVKKVGQGDPNKRQFGWSTLMDGTVGRSAVIIEDTFDDYGTYQLDNGWFYLAESLELVEDAPANEESVVDTVKAMPTIDSHYNFEYVLKEPDREAGIIKIDPYFVAKQWDLGSKDPSGVIWHIFKTCARFGAKNDKGREINAIYKSIKRLAELEGVDLD